MKKKIFCKNCNKLLNDSQRFCDNCGTENIYHNENDRYMFKVTINIFSQYIESSN